MKTTKRIIVQKTWMLFYNLKFCERLFHCENPNFFATIWGGTALLGWTGFDLEWITRVSPPSPSVQHAPSAPLSSGKRSEIRRWSAFIFSCCAFFQWIFQWGPTWAIQACCRGRRGSPSSRRWRWRRCGTTWRAPRWSPTPWPGTSQWWVRILRLLSPSPSSCLFRWCGYPFTCSSGEDPLQKTGLSKVARDFLKIGDVWPNAFNYVCQLLCKTGAPVTLASTMTQIEGWTSPRLRTFSWTQRQCPGTWWSAVAL